MYFTSVSHVQTLVGSELFMNGDSMRINYVEAHIRKITFGNMSPSYQMVFYYITWKSTEMSRQRRFIYPLVLMVRSDFFSSSMRHAFQ